MSKNKRKSPVWRKRHRTKNYVWTADKWLERLRFKGSVRIKSSKREEL